MPKWLIHGIDRSTGREIETILDAPDAASVRAQAERRQILITEVDPELDATATGAADGRALSYASPHTPPPRPSATAVPTATVHYATPRPPGDLDGRAEALAAARLFRLLARVCFIAGWWAIAGEVVRQILFVFQTVSNNIFSPTEFLQSILNLPQYTTLQLALVFFVASAVLRAAAAFTLRQAVPGERSDPARGPSDG